MYKLYLDDLRVPKMTYPTTSNSDWTLARNYNEFVKVIEKNGLPFFISFDHDLGTEHYADAHLFKPIDYNKYKEKTGLDCAKWLVEYCMDNKRTLPKYEVHSANPVGAENIRKYIESYERSINL